MFDLIRTVPRFDALRGVHEAAIRLGQRERLAWIKETAAFPVTDNPIAAQLLGEIERVEGRHLADLSQEETERYAAQLRNVLDSLPREGPPISEARAQALLEELRRDYGGPHYGRQFAYGTTPE